MAKAPPALADRIRRAREAAGLTQRELATRIGVSGPTIHHWEIGRQEPSLEKLQRIAHVVNVPVQEIAFAVIPPSALRELPLYRTGQIAELLRDGLPETVVETILVSDHDAQISDAAFILEDDSMAPYFEPGDIVAVKKQTGARLGEYVIARLSSGDITFKRYGGPTDEGFLLIPLNPNYQPIIDPGAEIVGVYRWLRREAPGEYVYGAT